MIFIDSSAWVALALPGDRNATRARTFYSDVQRGAHGSLVTTDFVLDEAISLVRMVLDAPAATRFAQAALGSKSLRIVWIDARRFRAAVEMMLQYSEKKWSLTDCTSFLVMQNLGIQKAFGFDRGFEQAGFTLFP